MTTHDRPLLAAGKYGPALRPSVLGPLSLFGPGSLAHDTTNLDSFSVKTHLERQFEQPVYTGNEGGGHTRGLESFRATQYVTATIMSSQVKETEQFVFKRDNAVSPFSAAERFRQLALAPPSAFLVCATVLKEVDANGAPLFGAPFLTVAQAPIAAPNGMAAMGSDVWPSSETLAPIGWAPPEDPMLLIGTSFAPVTRRSTTVSSMSVSRSDNLADVMYTTEGATLCDVGWRVTTTPRSPDLGQFYLSDLADLPPELRGSYLGVGASPASISAPQQAVMLPLAFPLGPGHHIPAGQMWSPTIGARDFRASLQEIYATTSADVHAKLQWTADMSLLGEWLDAVAANPRAFSVSFLARSSIKEAVMPASAAHPQTTEESLTLITWIDTGVARRLHRDCILAYLGATHAANFATFERLQLENFSRPEDDEPWFGLPMIAANVALWYLCLPSALTNVTKWGLAGFLETVTIPPEASQYLRIPLTTRKVRDYVPVQLETKTEAEEAEAEQGVGASPNTLLARRRLASAQKAMQSNVPGMTPRTLRGVLLLGTLSQWSRLLLISN